jgi:hypothetical protein
MQNASYAAHFAMHACMLCKLIDPIYQSKSRCEAEVGCHSFCSIEGSRCCDACRVPKLDEFLIVMQNILKSPEVHAALCDSDAPVPPPRRAAPVPSTVSSVTGAPSRLSRPPSGPGALAL